MREQLEQIKVNALAALEAAETPAALEELRVKLLGKKGEMTAVLKMMGKLSPEERPVMGQMANAVRAQMPKYVFFKTMPCATIELAQLTNDAGIIGAAMLGK